MSFVEPIGDKHSKIGHFLGSIARNDKYCTLDVKNWHAMPKGKELRCSKSFDKKNLKYSKLFDEKMANYVHHLQTDPTHYILSKNGWEILGTTQISFI